MNKGDVVGRYVIESLLGQGGMGSVYRAYDDVLRRSVAIKFLRASSEGPGSEEDSRSVVRRMLREARMAAALTHANVVAIHDVGEHDGSPFIVMELVTGRSLRSLINAEVPIADKVRWLVEVARGLAAAHAAGLVHRDVKPENVVVREDGAVKVLDFGIARRAQDARQAVGALEAQAAGTFVTAPGPDSSFAGTPAYMAPEVLRGEPTDARVDQFAWGVMGYELLSGRSPWGHAGPLMLQAVLSAEPPPLDAGAVGVAPEVTQTIARAMSKDPSARFASMDALIASMGASAGDSRRDARSALPAALADVGSAPTVPATYGSLQGVSRSLPPVRRRLVFAAAAMTAVAVAVVWRVAARPTHETRAADAGGNGPPASEPLRFDALQRMTLTPGCEEYPSFVGDGSSVLFDSQVADENQVVLLNLTTNARRVLTTGAGWHFAATLSPDGATVAYVAQVERSVGTYLVSLADAATPPRQLRKGPLRPGWSPDGTALWAGRGSLAERVDVKTGEATRRLMPPADTLLTNVLELADGRVVARAINRQSQIGQSLLRYDPGSDEPNVIYTGETEETLVLAPGGRDVLTGHQLPTGNTELVRVPLDGSAAATIGDNFVQPTKGMAFTADGARAVWSTCSSRGVLSFIDGRGKMRATPVFKGMEWADQQPAGVPGDPTKLVVASDRSGTRQLWVLDTAEAESARLLATPGLEPASPAVSADRRWVVFAAKEKGLYAVPLDGSAPAHALTSNAADSHATFGRDGRTVYFATPDSGGGRAIASVSVESPAQPVVLLHDATCPDASPADDRLVYIAGDEVRHEVRVLDLQTRASSPLSSAIHSLVPVLRFSHDGRRVAVGLSSTEIAEIDARRGTVLGKYETSSQIGSATYVGDRLVIDEWQWMGGLWTARIAGTGDR